MNKSSHRLSAVAAAALLSQLGTAHADLNTTLYGAIGLDVVSASKVYNKSTGKSGSVVKIDDNAIVNSRFGIKGGEDLGGGLNAVFGLESSIKPDTGAGGGGTFWNRGAYVGATGGFGSLKLGHQWDVADDYMGKYFVFAYYSAFFFDGFGSLSNYYDNAIKYNSPNMGGFEGGVFYSAGEQAGHSSAGQFYQATGTYTAGPFSAGLTLSTDKDPNGGSKGNVMYAGGLAYNFGVVNARLGLARADVNYAYNGSTKLSDYSGAYKAKLIDLGVDVPLSNELSASVDYVSKDKKSSDDDTSFLRFQGSYKLSKRTSLNANLIFLKNTGNASFAWYGDGAPGQKQTILTAGITHSF
jgi:predicted porin